MLIADGDNMWLHGLHLPAGQGRMNSHARTVRQRRDEVASNQVNRTAAAEEQKKKMSLKNMGKRRPTH